MRASHCDHCRACSAGIPSLFGGISVVVGGADAGTDMMIVLVGGSTCGGKLCHVCHEWSCRALCRMCFAMGLVDKAF